MSGTTSAAPGAGSSSRTLAAGSATARPSSSGPASVIADEARAAAARRVAPRRGESAVARAEAVSRPIGSGSVIGDSLAASVTREDGGVPDDRDDRRDRP